jgi:hypothetical protein
VTIDDIGTDAVLHGSRELTFSNSAFLCAILEGFACDSGGILLCNVLQDETGVSTSEPILHTWGGLIVINCISSTPFSL